MSLFEGIGAGLNFDARKTGVDPIGSPAGRGLFGFTFRKPIAGVPVNEESALTYSAVWDCVRLISEHIAMMPHRVHEQKGEKREVASGHAVDHLLYRQANPETNAFDFKQSLIAAALLGGNGLAEIDRVRSGEPGALWQIEWDRVNPTRDSAGRLVYEISNGGAANTYLRPQDVLHLKGFSVDGVVGLSPIMFAKQCISLGLAMEQFAAAFFGNGAIPGGVIEWKDEAQQPEEWGPDAARNQKKTWAKSHRGAANHGGIEIMEPGQTFKAIGIPPEASQFLESRKFGVTEICRWYGVPPHKLADLERSTNSNIEAQNIEYVTDCLMRWAVRFEQEVNAKLLRGNYYNKINFNSLLRGDMKTRQEYYKTMLDRGVYSINDVLGLEDRNPVDGGDLRMVPLNMVSLEQAAKNGNTIQQKTGTGND
ncbi:phage portal protein [Thalassolituus sp.]|uniref:phage portal protein n=1 Tax=Thalassolituus sp. TaxID=2030822 RepID=UPI00260FD881|nr:phage portal protein [Thalassolituus sp.]